MLNLAIFNIGSFDNPGLGAQKLCTIHVVSVCCLQIVNCDLTVVFARLVQNWYSYQYTCLQVIEYIKAKQGFTGLLLTHIGTSAVMDLLLRLITCVEGTENKQNILTVSS